MTASELRRKYLEFFQSKGHTLYPSGSLIPYDVTGRLDESLLFNGAGMVQFKPFFRGVAEPPNRRLTNCQKCVRTGDIEEVGNLSHLTFFEMLGNFSFGDYFKQEAIAFSWEFLTSPQWLGLDPKRLSFTVFEEDDEAFGYWCEHVKSVGIDPETRVFRLGEETNYWPAGAFSKGPPGPCGPNSEMFYWTSNDVPVPGVQAGDYSRDQWLHDDEVKNWLEIWNDVFIQFEWQGQLRNPERPSEGFQKSGMPNLPFRSVDTGMGLERTSVVLGGLKSVYDTDLFTPIIRKIEEIAGGYKYGSDPDKDRATRIICDHIRTACFCIADGILPGNTGRGYVLRRLIRRAVLKGQRVLGFDQPFFHRVYEGVVEAMGEHYTQLTERQAVIVETLKSEEALFRRTVAEGIDRLWDYLSTMPFVIARHFVEITDETPSPSKMWSEIVARTRKFEGAEQPKNVEVAHQGVNNYLSEIKELLQTQTGFRELIGVALADLRKAELSGGEYSHEPYQVELSGEHAFKLYDTYGFPLEVTQELCEEAGVSVDIEGYEQALKEAQERSRGASGMDTVYGGVEITFHVLLQTDDGKATPTSFRGYQDTALQAKVVGAIAVQDSKEDEAGDLLIAIALDQTPFYAESGGQVSDEGIIDTGKYQFRVVDVTKQDGVWVHLTEPVNFERDLGANMEEINATVQKLLFGLNVEARVDESRRRAIIRNHTATHLLHAALREVLGKHVTQAGSYVGPDRLRFDFTHGKAMTPDELAVVERMVNEQALLGSEVVIHNDVPIDIARSMGAMALFGEKYGDHVRVVEVPGYSIELCGGIHVRNTAEVGMFKILHEASAASGVRRIEAVTGEGAYDWAKHQEFILKESATLLKTTPHDLINAVQKHIDQLREERKRSERMRTQSADASQGQTVAVGEIELVSQTLTDGDVKDATLIVDKLIDGNPKRVALVGLITEGKVMFVCKVGDEAKAKGAHAGNLVKALAQIVGGGGGGRPDFATAGGRDPEKLAEAMAEAQKVVAGMIGG